MVELFANNGDPDQMLHSVPSDLGLHCLPITHFGASRLKCVNFAFVPFQNGGLPVLLKERSYSPQTNASAWQTVHMKC